MAEPLAELSMREVLHWLVDRVAPRLITDIPGVHAHASEVRTAIDKAFHWTPPKPALTPEEEQQLNALLRKQQEMAELQRQADALAAEEAAGVENVPLGGLPG